MQFKNEYHESINRSIHELMIKLMYRTGISHKLPELGNHLLEYCLQDGKRIRSTLFALSYLQQGKKACKNLYTGAGSLELMHLFALIQDDIIDNSDTRRGKLSLHKIIECTGKIEPEKARDLAVIFSDILYSAAIEAFMRIDEDAEYKEQAFKVVLDSAVHTGSGQFLELIYSSKNIEQLSLEEIYEIYDLKTARYTFCGPMIAGALLAGCEHPHIDILGQVGAHLGRAYQISDDILDFSNPSECLLPSDIVQQRKTILMWHLHTYGATDATDAMEAVYQDCTPITFSTLIEKMYKYGSFDFAIQEMNSNYYRALDLLSLCTLRSGTNNIFDFIVALFGAVKKECCI